MRKSRRDLLKACFLVKKSLNSAGGFSTSLKISCCHVEDGRRSDVLVKRLLPAGKEGFGHTVDLVLPIFIRNGDQERCVGVMSFTVDLL